MAVDLGVFGRAKSKADFDREAQEFEERKMLREMKRQQFEMQKQQFQREMTQPQYKTVGNTLGRFDQNTGAFEPIFTDTPKAPSGYMYAPDGGSLMPIPGSKQDYERTEAERKKKDALAAADAKTRATLQAIDQALGQAEGGRTSGWIGQQLKDTGGTNAYNLDQTLQTIRANMAFEQLQEMRRNSPTGGALGAVSDRELELLAATAGSLKMGQSDEDLVRNLQKIRSTLGGKLPASPAAASGGWSIREIK